MNVNLEEDLNIYSSATQIKQVDQKELIIDMAKDLYKQLYTNKKDHKKDNKAENKY